MSGSSRSPFHSIVRALTPKRYKNQHQHTIYQQNGFPNTVTATTALTTDDQTTTSSSDNYDNGIAYHIPDLGTLPEDDTINNNNNKLQTLSFLQIQPEMNSRSVDTKWYRNKQVSGGGTKRGYKFNNSNSHHTTQNQSISSCTTRVRNNTKGEHTLGICALEKRNNKRGNY